jgi:hypothetical protein
MALTEMQLDEYVGYHERLGKRIVWCDGVPFSEYRRRFLWSLPRFRPYDLGRADVRRVLARGALGAIAITSETTPREAAFCVSHPEYGLATLQKQTRNRVRRGLERCAVREVGWDEMAAKGLAINREALVRQRRASFLGDEAWWRRQCEVSAAFAGVRVWGAYVGDDLAAYVHVIVHAGAGGARPVAEIIHFMSDNRHLKSYPNEALVFTVTSDLLAAGCSQVLLGSGSDDPNLLAWKRHMGYVIETSCYHLVANPVMHLAKPFVPKLRMWMDGSLLGRPADAAAGSAA